MRSTPDGDYSLFLADLLPRFDLEPGGRRHAEDLLAELREYYDDDPVTRPGPGRVAVIAIDPWRDWAAEVKAAALVADLVICDDPLLYVQDHITNFAFFYRRTYGRETRARFLLHLRRQIDWMWQVMPLVRAGVLVFRPLRMSGDDTVSAVERFAVDYLAEHLDVLGYDVHGYPQWVEYTVPLLGEHAKQEIDRMLWAEEGMSPRQIAEFTVRPRLTIHFLTTWNGLLLAETLNGTFWTGSDEQWRLARYAVEGLAPATKVMSFVQTFTRPALERARAEDLLAIRADDDAFYSFRQALALAEGRIRSFPGDERFDADLAAVFEDLIRPNIRMIERSMRTNPLLKDLPFIASSAGVSYAAALAGASPPVSGLLGGLAGVLSFSSAFRDLRDPEAKVRREPAFVFWKLGVPGD